MGIGSGKITRENVVDAGGDLSQSVEVAAVAHCLWKEKEIHQQKVHKSAFDLIKKLDPVGSTVRYEMMKLCAGSV